MNHSSANHVSVRLSLMVLLAVVAALAAGQGLAEATPPEDEGDSRAQVLTVRGIAPLIACDGCEIATTPGAPVNARASVEDCGTEATCTHGGDVRITVTYAWPGGDPSTGMADGAQTCIRWFSEPPTLLMEPPGYAFGGDCSTNASGTTAEFRFIAPGAVTFCAQVDAFRGSTDLGSSNLACLDLEPSPDTEFEEFTPVELPALEGHALRLVYVDPVPPATVAPGVFVTAVIEFETTSPNGVRIWAQSTPEMVYLGSDIIGGASGTVVRWVIVEAGACITGLSITMVDAETQELLAGGSIEVDVCAVTDA